jgi:hypothetical protein
MPNTFITKATAALQESVASILNCDDDDATKRFALAESFDQFQTYIMEHNGGADITKAHRNRGAGGHRSLTGALLEHLHDRLERRREQHGYQKSARETSPMTALEDIAKSHGVPGVVEIAKNITEKQRSYRTTEKEFCKLIDTAARVTYPALGERALETVYERNPVLASAMAVIKAAEFSTFDIEPIVVGGPAAMHSANDDDDSAVLRAHEEIVRIAREKFPFLPSDVAFARIFEDKNYAALAAQAHRRPQPTTIYKMPGSTDPGRGAYTKADPVPNNDSAYGELMAKAEQLRSERPELSEAQAFSKVFTDPANVELAKRERAESVPR